MLELLRGKAKGGDICVCAHEWNRGEGSNPPHNMKTRIRLPKNSKSSSPSALQEVSEMILKFCLSVANFALFQNTFLSLKNHSHE